MLSLDEFTGFAFVPSAVGPDIFGLFIGCISARLLLICKSMGRFTSMERIFEKKGTFVRVFEQEDCLAETVPNSERL